MESVEKCQKGQTDKIIFRVKPQMKAFVREFSEKMGLDVSDFMRLVLEYYWMAFFTKTGSFDEIKTRFFDMYPDREEKNDDKTTERPKLGK